MGRFGKFISTGLLALMAGCSNSCVLMRPADNAPPIHYSVKINKNGDRVHISNYLMNKASHVYDGIDHELPMCISGRHFNDDYMLDDLSLPLFIRTHQDSARYNAATCPKDDYIGMIHNHRVPSQEEMLKYGIILPPQAFCTPRYSDRITGT